MSAPQHTASTLIDPLLDALFDGIPPPINQNLEERVVVRSDVGRWQPTKITGLSICVLENHRGASPRMSALLKLDTTSSDNTTGGVDIPANNLELLVEHGIVADNDSEYLHPFYIRHPKDRFESNQHFTLYPGSHTKLPDNKQLEFYIATGQLVETDTQRRCINLSNHSLWLPGPVQHTEVMPLHMHNGNNSMLVRWHGSGTFRPKLDPRGEEVLVIQGTLTDEYGAYSAGSWIRNPIAAWQAWGGSSGTLIYYKNGHFGTASN